MELCLGHTWVLQSIFTLLNTLAELFLGHALVLQSIFALLNTHTWSFFLSHALVLEYFTLLNTLMELFLGHALVLQSIFTLLNTLMERRVGIRVVYAQIICLKYPTINKHTT